MGRHAGVFSLRHWENGFWYYRLPGMTSYKTTGIKGAGKPADRHQAELFVREKIKGSAPPGAPPARRTLREYAEPFFVWEICPHCKKLRDEGRQITRRHAHHQRLTLKKYLLPDRIVEKPLQEITRAEVLDFRGRLAELLPDHPNTANKALAVLKTILKEAFFREDIARDPTVGVGNLKEHRKEAGIFTAEELRAMFPAEGLGPWRTLQEKDVFLVAASTGMRRGEILALRWRFVDFEKHELRIVEAWKGGGELGDPKWGHKRKVHLDDFLAAALRDLWERRPPQLAGADALVFCDLEGARLGDTWWMKSFTAAMKKVELGEGPKAKVGIDVRARGIKPHSFRHTVATLRRDAGEDPAKIRAALGWTNERTQGGYEHFEADMLRSDAIEKIWK
jgi:integrase